MMWYLKLILILIFLFLVDRLGLWAEQRGWVFWRNKKRGSSAFGNALGEFQSFLRPSSKHVFEVQQKKDVREQEKINGFKEN